MGYYSKVAIEMYAGKDEDVPVLHLWFDSQPIPEWAKDSFKKTPVGISYYDDSIKWDSADEVKAVLDNFEKCFIDNPDIDDLYDYEFVRLGEDFGDVETISSSGMNYLDVNRSINRTENYDD